MRTIARAVRGTVTVLLAGTVLVTAAGTTAHADDHGKGNGNGKAHSSSGATKDCGEYCSTRDGSPSRNGNGGGNATGRPCAGCVGNADDKNPPGQAPNGSDSNNGYECDGNSGVARTNPAHTGCTQPAVAPAPVVAAPAVTAPAPAPVARPATVVAGVRLVAQPVGTVGAKAPAETAGEVLGARSDAAAHVLGTRIARPAAVRPGSGSGTLPLTGTTTSGLLLLAAALAATGAVAIRAGARA